MINTEVLLTVQSLVEEQRQEQDRDPYKIHCQNPVHIFNQFARTETFEQLAQEAKFLLGSADTFKEWLGYLRLLRGATHQQIAFRFTRDRTPDSFVVLAPERTLSLYQTIYQDLVSENSHPPKILQVPFGLSSIEGMSVPDDVTIHYRTANPRVTEIVESTTNRSAEYFSRKARLERNRKHGHGHELLETATTVFYVPRDASRSLHIHGRKIEINKLPYSNSQLRDFISHYILSGLHGQGAEFRDMLQTRN